MPTSVEVTVRDIKTEMEAIKDQIDGYMMADLDPTALERELKDLANLHVIGVSEQLQQRVSAKREQAIRNRARQSPIAAERTEAVMWIVGLLGMATIAIVISALR